MRIILLLLIVAVLLSAYLPLENVFRLLPGAEKQPALRVHFIGNSLTFYHDIPGLVRALSHRVSGGRTLQVSSSAFPGVTLEWHFSNGLTSESLKNGHYDYVVLQEQSDRLARDPASSTRDLRAAVRMVREAGAKPLLYSIMSGTWDSMIQEDLERRLKLIARTEGAEVVPVSEVWQAFHRRNVKDSVFMPDRHHPSPLGSYLAALTFICAIEGQLPRGLPERLLPQPQYLMDYLREGSRVEIRPELEGPMLMATSLICGAGNLGSSRAETH